MFVGRQESLAHLWQWAAKPSNGPLLFLEGASGIGKTSLLIRLREGAFDSYLVPVIIDSVKLPIESPSEFLWRFSQQLTDGIRSHRLDVPEFEKSMLILRPWETFRDYYWKKLPTFLDNKMLILAMDNFDSLSYDPTHSKGLSVFRQYFLRLLNDYNYSRGILVLGGRAQGYTDKLLFPFSQVPTYRLRAFSYGETVELMSRPDNFPVYQDVAMLIFKLTSGHPGDIQRICHALYKRIASGAVRQLAMSDVLSILDVELAPKDFYTNVYGRYGQFFRKIGEREAMP